VTGPEIQEIRGVNVSGVIKTLLEKRLIVTAGRKAVVGKPILYRTSKEFLMRFGLSDLDELPSLKEFEQLARAALGSDEGIAPVDPEASPASEAETQIIAGPPEVSTAADQATEPSVEAPEPKESTAQENASPSDSQPEMQSETQPEIQSETQPETQTDQKLAESAS
jgi:segregation and condensation protein B